MVGKSFSAARVRAVGLATAAVVAAAATGGVVGGGTPAAAASCTPSSGTEYGYTWTATRTVQSFCVESVWGATLRFTTSGDLVLYKPNGKAEWSTKTSGRGENLTLASDAVVTVRGCTGQGGEGCSSTPSIIWSSAESTKGSPYKFDKFMIQVGAAADDANRPCWIIAARIKGGGWRVGKQRGDTTNQCDGTLGALDGSSGGFPIG